MRDLSCGKDKATSHPRFISSHRLEVYLSPQIYKMAVSPVKFSCIWDLFLDSLSCSPPDWPVPSGLMPLPSMTKAHRLLTKGGGNHYRIFQAILNFI